MNFNLSTLTDILFPPTEDEKNILRCTPESFEEKIRFGIVDDIRVLALFSDNEVRSAIHLVKFHGHKHATVLLSALLQKYLSSEKSEEKIIIPIPLSRTRQRQRGYNQVTLVAEKAVSGCAHICIRTDVLIRKKHTDPQTSLSREKRIQNMQGVFALTPHGSCIKGKHVVLLDDVTTTGSTLQQAKYALLPAHPASITCVALAH